MTIRIVAALSVALLALAACDDDGASVRDLGGSASSGSGSGTGAASGSGTAVECVDPGEGGILRVVLDDFTVTPDEDEITSGPTTFVAVNTGEVEHELKIVQAPNVESLPLEGDGGVDEEALAEGQVVAATEPVEPGESCAFQADLEPATYVLLCNIVDEGESNDRSHFLRGMRARIKVS